MAELVKQLAGMIRPGKQKTNVSKDNHKLKLEHKIEELDVWLRKVSQIVSADLYLRRATPIVDGAEQVIQKSRRLMKSASVFTDFLKILYQLEDAIRKVKWLIRISSGSRSGTRQSLLPPVAPVDGSKRSQILEQIAMLQTGSLSVQSEAAFSLVLLVLVHEESLFHLIGELFPSIEKPDPNRDPKYKSLLLRFMKYRNSEGFSPLYERMFLQLIENWNTKGDPQYVGKFIVDEGGVERLLKLLRDGNARGQENAAIAIGMLGHDMESVEHMVQAGVCSVFVNVLKEGPMEVQVIVAWAVSQLAQNFPKWQNHFLLHHIVFLLVDHLAFETLPDHYNDAARMSIHDVVMMSSNFNASNNVMENDAHNTAKNEGYANQKYVKTLLKDMAVKSRLKEMAAKALWKLAEGNLSICRSIVQSKALLCFALLLKEGDDSVKYNCAMALMEISRHAEEDIVTKRVGFKPNSQFFEILVERTLVMIKSARPEILIPCIRTSGHLAVLLRAKGVQVVEALVNFLRLVSLPSLSASDINDPNLVEWNYVFSKVNQEAWQLRWDIFDGMPNMPLPEVPGMLEDSLVKDACEEVLISLTKFASSDHYLHLKHSKEIITAGGVKPLTKLVSSDKQFFQIPALTILCYVALDVPHHKELKKNEVIIVLEKALKEPMMVDNEALQKLLPDAIAELKGNRPH